MRTNEYPTLIKVTLMTAICIVSLVYFLGVFSWNKNVSKVPPVGIGKYAVFDEEMDNTMLINSIASNEQYIYFAYSNLGVVAVYDWNGEYCCSYAFFTGTNGSLGIRCYEGVLYVLDHAGYEFVFSGTDNIAMYDPENRLHLIGWFFSPDELAIALNNQNVYDLSGKYIMPLPGRIR